MNKKLEEIILSEYVYDLPEERIAYNPPSKRSDALLLNYQKNKITHHRFLDFPNLLPSNTHLIFNDTKVIPARLFFFKDTGGMIEIFLLNSIEPYSEIHLGINTKKLVRFKCMIGNLKKWKEGQILKKECANQNILSAKLIDKKEKIVEFSWNNRQTFLEILTEVGKTPLPPYIKRVAIAEDAQRYQTVYSTHEGSVAAPTAGLHFDKYTFELLSKMNIKINHITLHVGAGTFQPIKCKNIIEHNMHIEQITIEKKLIIDILKNENIITVGTTSMRTVESLYWYGIKLLQNEEKFFIEKLFPYNNDKNITLKKSLEEVLKYMNKKGISIIHGKTEIFILPHYKFRVCKGLITNFHQPNSTLILLVAAFIGKDWKKVYQEALKNDYKFLSYGDASLLIP